MHGSTIRKVNFNFGTKRLPPPRGFPVCRTWLLQRLIYGVTADEKIRALCSQLLRAEDPVVLDTVSAELHHAIEEYVRSAKHAHSGCDIIPEPLPSSAF